MPMREGMRRLRPAHLAAVVACALALGSSALVGAPAAAGAAVPAGAAGAGPTSFDTSTGAVEQVPDAIPGRYIVRLQDGDPTLVWLRAAIYAHAFNGDVDQLYSAALQGFSV